MDIGKFMAIEGEQPLDNIVCDGGLVGIFRNIVCIGDSLSSGEFESEMNGKRGFHDCFEYSWGQYLARDAGCTVRNFSKGGMTAKKYCESFADEMGFWDESLKAQAYIVALGVNDVSRILEGVHEFGSIADVHPEDYTKNAPTFAGYYGQIISRYKAMAPKAKFFLMSAPSHHKTDERGILYDKHAELLYEIAKLFEGCYVLDLRKYAPDYSNPDYKCRFYLGGHLSAAGYLFTAKLVESYIDYIIRHNPEDFVQVSFINTDFYNETAKW